MVILGGLVFLMSEAFLYITWGAHCAGPASGICDATGGRAQAVTGMRSLIQVAIPTLPYQGLRLRAEIRELGVGGGPGGAILSPWRWRRKGREAHRLFGAF